MCALVCVCVLGQVKGKEKTTTNSSLFLPSAPSVDYFFLFSRLVNQKKTKTKKQILALKKQTNAVTTTHFLFGPLP
jgi:lipocalin